ncbi:DUF507 family protein [Geobacter sp.]|uniref:DUF507 family protein n=1 Tax=Geobacter sp. TaxID=46610 RepID=UPI001ACC4FFA|nr:DUF507 family protein [Geobacter sp.]CAG0995761.1 hypothetical protein GEOBC_02635 [Geobacteraceae bacterium]
MSISEDRVSHLAHRIYDRLWKDDLVDFPDERRSLQCIKEAISSFFAVTGEVDAAVRKKLASYAQAKVPGSREYEVLYQKFYQEEMARRKW